MLSELSPLQTHTHTKTKTVEIFLESENLPRADAASPTSPVRSLLLQPSFLLWPAPELLQRTDGALTHHRLPPELAVIDDFDDDGRHVKVLDREPLGRHGD